MAKPRINLRATFDTMAHADTVKDAVALRIADKDIFESHALGTLVDEDGANALYFDFRFNVDAHRDDLKDYMVDQIQNHPQVKNWVQSVFGS